MTNMTNLEFVARAKAIEKYNTIYMWGTFGQPVTSSLISSKTLQYSGWYSHSKRTQLNSKVGKNYYGIDCIGLIKAVHWGFPNIKYQSGGMPDTNANGYIKQCYDVSRDFSKIEIGEVVWMNGHIGIYVGDGIVLESTPSWKNGVQFTRLSQRRWTSHGKMRQVTYNGKTSSPSVSKPVTPTVGDKLKEDGYMGKNTIKAMQKHFGTTQDGVISEVSSLVKAIQKGLGLLQTGRLDKTTIKALQKHVGTSQDGVISEPSEMVKEIQRLLNSGDLGLKTSPIPSTSGVITSNDKRTTTHNLNMRTGIGTANKIMLTIPKGATVMILSESNGWAKVNYGGKVGYCSVNFLDKPNQKDVRKTTDNLNMRMGTSTRHAVILTIPKGTEVEVISESNGWALVTYGGKRGYSSAKYLRK